MNFIHSSESGIDESGSYDRMCLQSSLLSCTMGNFKFIDQNESNVSLLENSSYLLKSCEPLADISLYSAARSQSNTRFLKKPTDVAPSI